MPQPSRFWEHLLCKLAWLSLFFITRLTAHKAMNAHSDYWQIFFLACWFECNSWNYWKDNDSTFLKNHRLTGTSRLTQFTCYENIFSCEPILWQQLLQWSSNVCFISINSSCVWNIKYKRKENNTEVKFNFITGHRTLLLHIKYWSL